MFFNRKEPICGNGCFIPYGFMKLHEIDKISENNIYRSFCSFIILVVLFLLLDSFIGYDFNNNNYGILILILVIVLPILIIFYLSIYGLLRIYCHLSVGACPSCCQICFKKCCVNPNFDQKYEIITL